MTPTNSDYTFNFKIVYTSQTCKYTFHPDLNIKQFIEFVKFQSYETFNMVGELEFEVIEAGHPNNSGGSDAEMAPNLNYPDTATLRDIYENNWKTTSFYLRCVPLQHINHQTNAW